MRRRMSKRHGRIPGRLAVALLAAATVTAACGTATGPGGAPGRHHGPPWTTRAGSLAIAGKVLSHIVLPAGTRRLPQRPLPPGLREPASTMAATTYVDKYRLVTLPMQAGAAARFLRAHPPAGMRLQGTGSRGSGSGRTERHLTFGPRHKPFGIFALALVETIVPGHGRHALMRADAEVIWYPRRPAAEHLNPADYDKVQITVQVYGARLRMISRTFSSPRVIARLIRLLNGLPAAPGEAVACPAGFVAFRVAFRPAAFQPYVLVSRSGCASDEVTVGGRPQPALSDFGSLQALVLRLLHLHHLVPVGPRS